MGLRYWAVWVGIVAVFLLGGRTARADLGDEAYCLPLVGPYAIYRDDVTPTPDSRTGLYRLVELRDDVDTGAVISFTTVIPHVQQVAVVGKIIIGEAKMACFLLDTSQPDPQPRYVANSLERWHTLLTASGVDPKTPLSNPDDLAAVMPDATLRPWRYRIMQGFLGCTDGTWSVVFEIAAAAVAFVIGFAGRRGVSLFVSAGLLAVVTNLIARMIVAGAGWKASGGFIVLPPLFCLAAFAGQIARKRPWAAKPPPPAALTPPQVTS